MIKKQSFTLIELLIVLVIIGIIATLAISQYNKFVIYSRSAEAKQCLRAFADSAWRYYLETGDFPFHLGELDVSISGMSNNEGGPPSTKYFYYYYLRYPGPFHPGGRYVYFFVYAKTRYENIPWLYRISFWYKKTDFPTETVYTKLNEDWSMVFTHMIEGRDEPSNERPGWP